MLFNTHPGAILILHDGSEQRARTVAVLDRVLAELQRRGYRVVTVSELLARAQSKQEEQ
jgi:peptidoglycan/xylan/chitin deacetylase (PgdA/CDA1 family)